jgi:hypothetical protein
MDTKYMKGFSFATLIIFKIGMCYAQPFFNFKIDSSVYNELNHPYSILPDQYWTPATSSSSNIIMPFNFNFYGEIFIRNKHFNDFQMHRILSLMKNVD